MCHPQSSCILRTPIKLGVSSVFQYRCRRTPDLFRRHEGPAFDSQCAQELIQLTKSNRGHGRKTPAPEPKASESSISKEPIPRSMVPSTDDKNDCYSCCSRFSANIDPTCLSPNRGDHLVDLNLAESRKNFSILKRNRHCLIRVLAPFVQHPETSVQPSNSELKQTYESALEKRPIVS